MTDREFLTEVLAHLRCTGYEINDRDNEGNPIPGFACHAELDRHHGRPGPVLRVLATDVDITGSIWLRDLPLPEWARDPGLSNDVTRVVFAREVIFDRKRRAMRVVLESRDFDRYLQDGVDMLDDAFRIGKAVALAHAGLGELRLTSIGRWARTQHHPEERLLDKLIL